MKAKNVFKLAAFRKFKEHFGYAFIGLPRVSTVRDIADRRTRKLATWQTIQF